LQCEQQTICRLFLGPHDLATHSAVFNQAFPAASFRGPFFGGGHATASAFLCHLNFSSSRFSCTWRRDYCTGLQHVLCVATHNRIIPEIIPVFVAVAWMHCGRMVAGPGAVLPSQ
jgi:hypothetical protein